MVVKLIRVWIIVLLYFLYQIWSRLERKIRDVLLFYKQTIILNIYTNTTTTTTTVVQTKPILALSMKKVGMTFNNKQTHLKLNNHTIVVTFSMEEKHPHERLKTTLNGTNKRIVTLLSHHICEIFASNVHCNTKI